MKINVKIPYENAEREYRLWAHEEAKIDFLRDAYRAERCTLSYAAEELVNWLSEAGLSVMAAANGVAHLNGVRGRMEKLPLKTDFSVIIDFAHTPDALSKLLESVRGFRKNGQRIVTVFGCGGDRDPSKRSLMGAIASRLSDFVIITSDNSRSEDTGAIIDEIMSGFDRKCPYKRIDDRKKAIIYAVRNAMKGDIILLCGKGHEEYEIDMSGTHPFSERDIVYSAISDGKDTL